MVGFRLFWVVILLSASSLLILDAQDFTCPTNIYQMAAFQADPCCIPPPSEQRRQCRDLPFCLGVVMSHPDSFLSSCCDDYPSCLQMRKLKSSLTTLENLSKADFSISTVTFCMLLIKLLFLHGMDRANDLLQLAGQQPLFAFGDDKWDSARKWCIIILFCLELVDFVLGVAIVVIVRINDSRNTIKELLRADCFTSGEDGAIIGNIQSELDFFFGVAIGEVLVNAVLMVLHFCEVRKKPDNQELNISGCVSFIGEGGEFAFAGANLFIFLLPALRDLNELYDSVAKPSTNATFEPCIFACCLACFVNGSCARFPTITPSNVPSFIPSRMPSFSPSSSLLPTMTRPSTMPSQQPSPSSDITSPPFGRVEESNTSIVVLASPMLELSASPSGPPSHVASSVPSTIPSCIPSCTPSGTPSHLPSHIPSGLPSTVPSDLPSSTPSSFPSTIPSDLPSMIPSNVPSDTPSVSPSVFPSAMPSDVPSNEPTNIPSNRPSTLLPSSLPTNTASNAPSMSPTVAASSVPSTMRDATLVFPPTIPFPIPQPRTEGPTPTEREIALQSLLSSVSDRQELESFGTPQNRAMTWLANNDTRQISPSSNNDDNNELLVQRYLLALLYFATEGDSSWRDNTSKAWHIAGPECDWDGINTSRRIPNREVGCNANRRVLSINLDNVGLRGQLPSELFSMTDLIEINLNRNCLQGTLPSQIGKLESLQFLSMDGNELGGDIPLELWNLPNVNFLSMARNDFEGEIPETSMLCQRRLSLATLVRMDCAQCPRGNFLDAGPCCNNPCSLETQDNSNC